MYNVRRRKEKKRKEKNGVFYCYFSNLDGSEWLLGDAI